MGFHYEGVEQCSQFLISDYHFHAWIYASISTFVLVTRRTAHRGLRSFRKAYKGAEYFLFFGTQNPSGVAQEPSGEEKNVPSGPISSENN